MARVAMSLLLARSRGDRRSAERPGASEPAFEAGYRRPCAPLISDGE
eukprot:CAMPEP_0206018176 /NCGR_PEP_ID=MMETSP1464-20131121/26528_1 /ASSEMBLY_ACC=CAM_ASM_001124 /TAXON_ID=119497 /ORGANISM="Exanthemachrysis gayraliae, Strain RCC1523" /LENGTH=46 /DNA_ID= /DNA_START= /DNA_END= /DNA_ORIENTATION=